MTACLWAKFRGRPAIMWKCRSRSTAEKSARRYCGPCGWIRRRTPSMRAPWKRAVRCSGRRISESFWSMRAGFNSDAAQKAIARGACAGALDHRFQNGPCLVLKFPAMDPAKTFAVSSKTGAGLDSSAVRFPRRCSRRTGNPRNSGSRANASASASGSGSGRGTHSAPYRCEPCGGADRFELRGVRDSLASIIGEISSEDILQNIFSKFCIGK